MAEKKIKNKKQFIVVEHCSESPIQKAGVNYVYFTHDAAVESIISTLKDNFEIDDDGKISDYEVHLPDCDDCITTENVIRKKMKSCDSLIVDHGDYEVRYDIIELIM